MKTIAWMVMLMSMVACGGSTAEQQQQSAAGAPDVSGLYTLNQYASYLVPHAETISLSGRMALFQDGSALSGIAFLGIQDHGAPFNYGEARSWSGAMEVQSDGVVVVQLHDTGSGITFTGVRDESGNLKGWPGVPHGLCERPDWSWPCDAIR